MQLNLLKETDKPGFCWDRNWSIAEIRQKLAQADEKEHISLAAWILREGTFTEIWNLLFPSEVFARQNSLLPYYLF